MTHFVLSQISFRKESKLEEDWKHWIAELSDGVNWEDLLEKAFYLSLDFIGLFLICYVVFKLTDKVLLRGLDRAFRKTKNKFDDLLIDKNVLKPLSYFIPMLVVWWLAGYFFWRYPLLIQVIERVAAVAAVASLVTFFQRFLSTVGDALDDGDHFRDKPVHSYVQLVTIVGYVLAAIVMVSILAKVEVTKILTTLSALTAVVILVFKDTLLGFVSSLLISANDMIRVGDWITVKDFGADGTVLKITLNVVKVQNFDKTISMVPTYAFISHSFQNWRGMEDSGVRRIKRSLNFNMSKVRFVDADFEAKLKTCLGPSMPHSFAEKLVGSSGNTNLTLFRHFTECYLKAHPEISGAATIMVRQLQPTAEGLPLEVYAFSKTIDWVEYERIQADIFDFLIASASCFDLDIYQGVTGADLSNIKEVSA
ncbi:hypothetical protein FUAX_22430 [Fulvitalea axinellae]|uniref:Mechanosensitive ion channel MscS domain-containing protein n=1 Tax=Fulvitalea axinellae TaxID=1182444 RepID=A0AAU9CLD3_9BACT|nr:hypothetical protein FUAX_22430 [Fulvitalea axinellae]